jgi:hypothetical protein
MARKRLAPLFLVAAVIAGGAVGAAVAIRGEGGDGWKTVTLL